MEHLVLARKYRPQKFREVVEQQTAVQSLGNALAHNRLGSAYLFFGPRGVGKTTIARILAKRVNCQSPADGEPCDACDSCRAILSGNSLDVIEIDAASHRGIQHIRELRENVQFQPMSGKKKIYIIDEVHMLTTESFNALLKTLEEPPSHVLFILATTEYSKVPETILSRCQVFVFRKAPLKIIQAHLKDICAREKIPAEEEALFWVARRGDGSVRDSLSFLEQAITFCGDRLTTERVKELTGSVSIDLFLDLCRALLDAQTPQEDLMRPIHEIFASGGDLDRFVWEYLDFLRVAVHIRKGIVDAEFLGLPGPEIHRVDQALGQADPARLLMIFQAIYELFKKTGTMQLRNSYETRVLIEMELIDLRERLARPSLSGILQKLGKLSASIQQGVPYSPESDLQKQFLGTMVDPKSAPNLDDV